MQFLSCTFVIMHNFMSQNILYFCIFCIQYSVRFFCIMPFTLFFPQKCAFFACCPPYSYNCLLQQASTSAERGPIRTRSLSRKRMRDSGIPFGRYIP